MSVLAENNGSAQAVRRSIEKHNAALTRQEDVIKLIIETGSPAVHHASMMQNRVAFSALSRCIQPTLVFASAGYIFACTLYVFVPRLFYPIVVHLHIHLQSELKDRATHQNMGIFPSKAAFFKQNFSHKSQKCLFVSSENSLLCTVEYLPLSLTGTYSFQLYYRLTASLIICMFFSFCFSKTC